MRKGCGKDAVNSTVANAVSRLGLSIVEQPLKGHTDRQGLEPAFQRGAQDHKATMSPFALSSFLFPLDRGHQLALWTKKGNDH
jgi:hypothetical protein